jgi:hypothetical protein
LISPLSIHDGDGVGRVLDDRVVLLEFSSALAQLGFGFDSPRDVSLESDVVCNRAGLVSNRGDRELVPEFGTILAGVENVDGDRFVARDRVSEAIDGLGIGVVALEKPAVVPHDLVFVVSGQLQKPLVAVDDRIVVASSIRDDDALLGGVDGPTDQTELSLIVLAFEGVLDALGEEFRAEIVLLEELFDALFQRIELEGVAIPSRENDDRQIVGELAEASNRLVGPRVSKIEIEQQNVRLGMSNVLEPLLEAIGMLEVEMLDTRTLEVCSNELGVSRIVLQEQDV